MQLRDLKPGTRLSPEITIQSALDAHRGIASYLATDGQSAHCLVHVVDAKARPEASEAMHRAAEFARNTLGLMVDSGVWQNNVYYAEPFPLGEFMFEWLERKERIQPIEAIKRTIDLLRILIQAHAAGVSHGRITPKTILLEQKGFAFGLRLMGLGVAEALPAQEQLDIDWFDYTFDLEGMSKAAVDIYGIAIILMGLVSGESGIDGFETTGLLPPPLRGGLLQQAMERALALRIEAYQDILSFCKDLEGALLELDAKQGEMYVGDLVGFEAAVRMLAPQREQEDFKERSGLWSAIVAPLEQEERSSLLYSLTSLQAIRGDEVPTDAEVTNVTAVSKSLLNMRRIRSKGSDNSDLTPSQEEKTCITAPPEAPSPEAETQVTAPPKAESFDLKSAFEDIQSQALLVDEEDDAPTRIMMRPNYASISHSDISSINSVDITSESKAITAAVIRNKIMQTEVILTTLKVGRDVQYAEDLPVTPTDTSRQPSTKPQQNTNSKKQIRRRNFSKIQTLSILLLVAIIVALLTIIILKS